MGISFASAAVDALKVGAADVDRAYLGGSLVWGSPVTTENPVTVLEQRATTFEASGPQSVTFTTTPEPGDVVVVLYGCHRASSIRTISSITGMGGTWAVAIAQVGQVSMWIGTDVSTAGTVTINQNASAPMTAHLYLVRGLTSTAVRSLNVAIGGGQLGQPGVEAARGQIAFSWECSFDATLANTVQFPGMQLPATDWVTSADNTFTSTSHFGSSYRTPESADAVLHVSQAQIGSGDAGAVITAIVGAVEKPLVLDLSGGSLGANGSSITSWLDGSDVANVLTVVGTPPTVLTGATPNGASAAVFNGGGFLVGGDWFFATDTYSATYLPSRAFDATPTTWWHSLTASGVKHLGFRAGVSAKVVTEYGMRSQTAGGLGASAWDFQGSNDRLTWTTLDSQSGVTWAGNQLRTYPIGNTTPYLYYRINFTTVTDYLRVQEVVAVGAEFGSVGMFQAGDGELWAVLKANTPLSATNRGWVTTGAIGNNHYPYSNQIYDGTGSNTRKNFSPVADISAWHVYRVQAVGTAWNAYIDGVLRHSTTANTKTWLRENMHVGLSASAGMYFSGQVAAFRLYNRALSVDEAAAVLAGLNAAYLL